MAVDSNFERLEQEVGRLVDILGALRQENVELKSRVEALETENERMKNENVRLLRVEEQYEEATQNREVVRGRIEALLSKLDSVDI